MEIVRFYCVKSNDCCEIASTDHAVNWVLAAKPRKFRTKWKYAKVRHVRNKFCLLSDGTMREVRYRAISYMPDLVLPSYCCKRKAKFSWLCG